MFSSPASLLTFLWARVPCVMIASMIPPQQLWFISHSAGVQLLPDLYDISEIRAHKRPPGRRGGVGKGLAHYCNDMGSIPAIGDSAEWAALAFNFSAGPAACVSADVPRASCLPVYHFIRRDRAFSESEVVIEQFGDVREYRDRSFRSTRS